MRTIRASTYVDGRTAVLSTAIVATTSAPWLDLIHIDDPPGERLRVVLEFSQGSIVATPNPQTMAISVQLVGRAGHGAPL